MSNIAPTTKKVSNIDITVSPKSLYKYLKEYFPEAAEKYRINWWLDKDRGYDITPGSLASVLMNSFYWDHTPEKNTYWQNLYDKLPGSKSY